GLRRGQLVRSAYAPGIPILVVARGIAVAGVARDGLRALQLPRFPVRANGERLGEGLVALQARLSGNNGNQGRLLILPHRGLWLRDRKGGPDGYQQDRGK